MLFLRWGEALWQFTDDSDYEGEFLDWFRVYFGFSEADIVYFLTGNTVAQCFTHCDLQREQERAAHLLRDEAPAIVHLSVCDGAAVPDALAALIKLLKGCGSRQGGSVDCVVINALLDDYTTVCERIMRECSVCAVMSWQPGPDVLSPPTGAHFLLVCPPPLVSCCSPSS